MLLLNSRFRIIYLLIAMSFRVSASPISEQLQQSIKFNPVNQEITVDLKQLPLEPILSALTRRTQIPIHYSVLPSGLITATCLGNITQVLECLLAQKADLAVRYLETGSQSAVEKTNKQPSEIWILGAQYSNPDSCHPNQVELSQTELADLEALKTAQNSKPDEIKIDQLLKQASSDDASQRANAIGALFAASGEGEAEIKKTLETALSDPDANVRAQAISSLAHREGSEAVFMELQTALHDQDPAVRLMAVDGATDNAFLLRQAAQDKEEFIRNLAISKLTNLNQITK